jgi:hypothetical protein
LPGGATNTRPILSTTTTPVQYEGVTFWSCPVVVATNIYQYYSNKGEIEVSNERSVSFVFQNILLQVARVNVKGRAKSVVVGSGPKPEAVCV